MKPFEFRTGWIGNLQRFVEEISLDNISIYLGLPIGFGRQESSSHFLPCRFLDLLNRQDHQRMSKYVP
jgi:hypothetical protein